MSGDRSFQINNLTFVAVASAANFTDNGYMALQGGAANQISKIKEIFAGGEAAASAIMELQAAFDSTLGATLTALAGEDSNGPLVGVSAISGGPTGFKASTVKPQRGGTGVGKLAFSFNSFGGFERWQAPPGGEVHIIGNATVSVSEFSLSGVTGTAGGPCSCHFIYETL